MRILHIIDSGGLYGAEIVLLNLVAEQMKLGLDPAIVSIGKKGVAEKPLETQAMKRGFRVKKFRMRRGPNYLGALKILRFAHKEGFDLMHCHGYKGNILFGFMPNCIRDLPLVSTLHGWTSTNRLTRIALYEWLAAKSLNFIDGVVLVNKGMLSNSRLRKLDRKKVFVVNNGIPISDTQFNDSTNQPIPQSGTQSTRQTQGTQATEETQVTLDQNIVSFCRKAFTIGSIGRLSKEKGYRYFIEALTLLMKNSIDAQLVILGEGPERRFLEHLVEQHNLSDVVLMPGYKEDAKTYIPYFNLFVLPSLTEGLPMTLLEAMQARVPIVATKVGGMPEVLQNGKGGLLVESASSKDLAEAISAIYHDTEFANELITTAYKRAVSEYSSQEMAIQYFNIYQSLVDNRS
jgi:glycosyltransferase involved in cell wall biosynthesis